VTIGITVIKTFLIGFFLGVAGVFAALEFLPAVDLYREASIISVTPNGGNTEVFHVKVPTDRIMIGTQDQGTPIPRDIEWPDDPKFNDVRAELFKLRNSRDAVIGIAGRIASKDTEFGDTVEWVLHLPARGSMVAKIQPSSAAGGVRAGTINSGTREFGALRGQVSERWVSDVANSNDARSGRIELKMDFVGTEQYDPFPEVSE
jgi:hypothetical protein